MRSIALLLIFSILTGQASAACTQADIAGAWRVFTSTIGERDNYWIDCRLQLRENGAIRIRQSTCIGSELETENRPPLVITGGRFVLRNDCSMTGRIVTESDGIDEFVAGQMTLSRDAIHGIGVYGFDSPANPIERFSFIMIRR